MGAHLFRIKIFSDCEKAPEKSAGGSQVAEKRRLFQFSFYINEVK